jgi:hypothetical protein
MWQFGDFAVGIDPIAARALGVLPVLYYYKLDTATSHLPPTTHFHSQEIKTAQFGPSEELMFRLAELRNLLIAIAHVEALGAPKERPVYSIPRLIDKGYVLKKEDKVKEALTRLGDTDKTIAQLFFDCLDTDRMPGWNLIEWIDILLNAFQIADDRDSNVSLRYYQQREWRLVQFYSPTTLCHPLDPEQSLDTSTGSKFSENKREALITLILAHSARQKFSVDLTKLFLFEGTRTRHIRSFIQEILVPKELREKAKEWIAPYFQDSWKQWQTRDISGSTVFYRSE